MKSVSRNAPAMVFSMTATYVLLYPIKMWCGPCLNFVPELERLHEKYSLQGLEVLAIHSKQGSESAAKYIEQHPKPWPNLIDNAERLQTSFKVPSFPSTYIFDTEGKLRVALSQRQALDQTLKLLFDRSK